MPAPPPATHRSLLAMTTPGGIGRKVRQLDNDVQSVYEMLAEIAATQRRQTNRLTEMDSKLTEMDGNLGTIVGLLRGSRPLTDAGMNASATSAPYFKGRHCADSGALPGTDGPLGQVRPPVIVVTVGSLQCRDD